MLLLGLTLAIAFTALALPLPWLPLHSRLAGSEGQGKLAVAVSDRLFIAVTNRPLPSELDLTDRLPDYKLFVPI